MKKILLVLILYTACNLNCIAAKPYSYVPITVKNGLASNTVYSICRDYKGLLWMATEKGLCCGNGDKIEDIVLDKNALRTKPRFVVESVDSTIWVGSSEHLFFLKRGNSNFVQISLKKKHGRLLNVCKNDSLLCFGCSKGVFIYDGINKNIRFVTYPNKQTLYAPCGICFSIDSNIIIASNKGVQKFEFHIGKISILVKKKQFKKYHPSRIISLPNKEYIIATHHKGVFLYSRDGKLSQIDFKSCAVSRYPMVLDMVKRDRSVWIATDGDGVLIYNYNNKCISCLKHIQGNNQSLISNSIQDLFVDKYKNIFAGSVKSGLSCINESTLSSYKEVLEGGRFGLSNGSVISVCEDSKYHHIWIGTDGGGLNVYLPDKDEFIHVSEFKNEKIMSLCEFKPGKLIVRLYRKGSKVFDIDKMRFDNDTLYPWLNTSIDDLSLSIFYSKGYNHRVWKLGKGIEIIEPNGTVTTLSRRNGWKGQLSLFMTEIIPINDSLYLGIGLKGAHYIDFRQKRVSPISRSFKLETNNSFIAASIVVQDGKIWISSNYGLLYYENNTINRYDIKGVDWETICSIADGGDNILWIGTTSALYQLDLRSETVRYFGESEGASCYEYSRRGTCSSMNGNVYMGANNGLVVIKNRLFSNYMRKVDAFPFINHITVNGEKVDTYDNEKTIAVQLPWDNERIEISISVDESSFFRQRKFKYFIDGYSEKVVVFDAGNLILGNLPPGEYLLNVWCDLPDGGWKKMALSLLMIIERPWWKHWIFGVTIFGVICIALIGVLCWSKERTKLKYELDLEKRRKADITEMVQQKDLFLTKMSSELRTPLTLIYGPIRQLLRRNEVTQSQVVEQLRRVDYQATKMKKMLDNVLEFKRINSQYKSLSFSTVNFHDWFKEVLDQFQDSMMTKDISLRIDLPKDKFVELDVDNFEMVLSGLIQNVVACAPVGSVIIVIGTIIDQIISIQIKDNGRGITQGHIENLSKFFSQGDNTIFDHGVRLSYAKRLIGLMNGTIHELKSGDNGAAFEVVVPCEERTDNVLFDDEDYEGRSLEKRCETSISSILLLENDSCMIEFIQNAIGYCSNLIIVSSEDEVWDILSNQSIEIIIADANCLCQNGNDFCCQIKSDANLFHIPVLILSGDVDSMSKILAFQSGVDLYLTKPFEEEEFVVMVRSLLRKCSYTKNVVNVYDLNEERFQNMTSDDVFHERIIKTIQDNLQNPYLDATFIQSKLEMSRSSLYVKFKAVIGEGIGEYIRNQRIKQASQLLKNTNLSVKQISLQVGFDNQRYFSTVFKDHTGHTPSRYRQI
ncbi:helix-turn-helix domain-containing protein [Prolixibacteraceae bacterium]|nr:helix-turn-helix domain-containing protein [Prolixibacteraceae bacterium]